MNTETPRKSRAVDNLPEKRYKRTRRKVEESDEECILPANIPLTKTLPLICFESNERQTTKLLIQVPHALLQAHNSQNHISIKLQEATIQLRVRVDNQETIAIDAKIPDEVKCLGSGEDAEDNVQVLSVWGKSYWVGSHEVCSKITKQVLKRLGTEFEQIQKIRVKEARSDVFLLVNFRQQIRLVCEYNGLINQGSTCYMNSYLQMLFHISQFRNLVFEAHIVDENKFPATLQILFYKLAHDQKAVSAEPLAKSFGWSKKEIQTQQDAQEFSCLFFEALEKKLEEFCFDTKRYKMRELFNGKLLHLLQCTNVGTIIRGGTLFRFAAQPA